MSSRRSLHAALVACAFSLLPGCFKAYVVVSFRPPAEEQGVAEASDTPRLRELRGSVKAVAVRAPAACSEEASAVAGGAGIAARSRSILETRCATLLGELERALATRYRVVGWREVAAAGKSEGVSLAAYRPAADVVLVVNDLSPTPVLVSDMDGPSVVLSDATPDGTARGPAKLSKGGERFIRDLLARRFTDGALAGVAVRLEVTAVSGATGEPLWTYRRRLGDALEGALDGKILLRGRGSTWRPIVPRGMHGPIAARKGEAPPPDPVQARMREIGQTLADDVVARFSSSI